MATISSLYVKILGDSTSLERSLATSAAQLRAFGSSATTSSATTSRALTASKVAMVALGAATVDAIGKGIQATQDWASEVRSLQRVTGQTAEQASALAGGASTLGISVDKLTVGFGLLSKNIVNGAPNLVKYGIATRDAKGQLLPFDDILDNVADKFVTLKPGAEQAAFAMNVFGRSGKTLIPILSKGSEFLDELRQRAEDAGLVMSQDTLDAAKDLTVAENELGDAVKGASISLGEAFLPVAKIVVDVMTEMVKVFVHIPTPVKVAGAAFVVLTGFIAGAQFVAAFLAKTWGGLLKSIGLTPVPVAEATASLEVLGDEAVATSAKVGATGRGGLIGALSGLSAAASVGIVAGVAAVAGSIFILAHAAQVAHDRFEAGVLRDLEKLREGGRGAVQQLRAIANQPVIPATAPGAIPTRFDFLKPQVQAQAQAIDQASEALKRYRHELELGNLSQQGLANSIGDMVASAPDATRPLTEIGDLTLRLSIATDKAFRGVEKLTAVSGQDFTKIRDDVLSALADPATKLEDLPGIYSAALGQVKAEVVAWHDSIVSNFGGASDALSQFLGQAAGEGKDKVSFANLTDALKTQQQELKRWRSDFQTIMRENGSAARTFLQDMSQNGLDSIGILDEVAKQPKKIRDEFFAQYDAVNKTTGTIADKIVNAFGKAADRIVDHLDRIYRKVAGLPVIKPKVDSTSLDNLIVKLGNVTNAINIVNQAINAAANAALPTPPHGNRHHGGYIFHDGGSVLHGGGMPRNLGPDEVPAILQRGEFVLQRSAVQSIGRPALEAMNRLHDGGAVPAMPALSGAPLKVEVNARVEPDVKRFTRRLDLDPLTDGYW